MSRRVQAVFGDIPSITDRMALMWDSASDKLLGVSPTNRLDTLYADGMSIGPANWFEAAYPDSLLVRSTQTYPLVTWGLGASGSQWTLAQSNGTESVPAASADADILGAFGFTGIDTGLTPVTGAGVASIVDGTVSAGIIPTFLQFNTMNAAGIYAARVRVTPEGDLVPVNDSAYEFGSTTLRWLKGWLDDLDVAGTIIAGTLDVTDYGLVAGDIPDISATYSVVAHDHDADYEALGDIATHASDADAHHNWPLLAGDIPDISATYLPLTGGSIAGDLDPDADSTRVMGADALRWLAGYFDNLYAASLDAPTQLTLRGGSSVAISDTTSGKTLYFNGTFRPTTDNDVGFGASWARWAGGYFGGTVYADYLHAGVAGAAVLWLDNEQDLSGASDLGRVDFQSNRGVGARITGRAGSSHGSGDSSGVLRFYVTPSGSTTPALAWQMWAAGTLVPGADSAFSFGSDSLRILAGYFDEVDTPQVTVGTPTITSGSGAPSASEPDGSVYLRDDGGSSTTFYVRESGAWVAK